MKKILRNKWIQMIIISFISFYLVLINYVYIRPYYIQYDSLLRCVDHFIAGIGVTWIIALITNNYKFSAFTYLIASFAWEMYEFWKRNFKYYQYGQSLSDILGILIFILIIKLSNNILYTGYGSDKFRRLDKEKYRELYEWIYEISNKIGVVVKKVYVKKSELICGGRAGLNNIYISDKLLARYSEDPHIAKLVICHEIAHIKNKDTSLRGSLEALIWGLIGTERAVIKMLLRETRANIEGAAISGLSKEEIIDAYKTVEEHNKKVECFTEYKFGYPSRDKRAKYSIKYNEFNKAAVDEITKDYYDTKNMKYGDTKAT